MKFYLVILVYKSSIQFDLNSVNISVYRTCWHTGFLLSTLRSDKLTVTFPTYEWRNSWYGAAMHI